jgi:hypothetical protein
MELVRALKQKHAGQEVCTYIRRVLTDSSTATFLWFTILLSGRLVGVNGTQLPYSLIITAGVGSSAITFCPISRVHEGEFRESTEEMN